MAIHTDPGALHAQARTLATAHLGQRPILRAIRDLARSMQAMADPREMLAATEELLRLVDQLEAERAAAGRDDTPEGG
jgi:hypothetical protein